MSNTGCILKVIIILVELWLTIFSVHDLKSICNLTSLWLVLLVNELGLGFNKLQICMQISFDVLPIHLN